MRAKIALILLSMAALYSYALAQDTAEEWYEKGQVLKALGKES